MTERAAIAKLLVAAAYLLAVVSPQTINVTSTWISGTSTANSPSVLGTMGVPSTAIYPGARVLPCVAISTQDYNYKIYVYGGQGYGTVTLSYLHDFWVLTVATMQWTMLPQNSVNLASVGTRGFESSSTFPGNLGRMACLINPRDNYLYMFGGNTGPRFNDMWRYNPTSGYWAWLGGGSSATPTINVESSIIFPTTRRNTAMVAHPTLNILIVMSGSIADSAGDMNDMWKFNLDTNAWTWFAGSLSAVSVPSVFDAKGVATAANFPGGRNGHTTYMNPTTVLMYLFGGLSNSGAPYFNDMWSYDYASGMWTWISGGPSNNQVPVRGLSGIFDATYTPGARATAIFSKVSGTTYLNLYGGRGYGVNSVAYNAYLNEMWFFDYSTNQWAWIAGANEANTYGTKGVTSFGPYPQGRNLYASSSMAFNQSLIIFGGFAGTTTSYMADMWKLDFSVVSSANASSTLVTTSSDTTIIAVATLTVSSLSTASATSDISSSTSKSTDTSAASATYATLLSLSNIDSILPVPSQLSSVEQATSSQLATVGSTTSIATMPSSTTRSTSVSSSSRTASITTSASSSPVLLGSSTRSSSSSKAATTTVVLVMTSAASLKSSSTKLTVKSSSDINFSTATTTQATATLSGPGDTAALSDNATGVDSFVQEPAIIAALVAALILGGVLLIKLYQRKVRRNNFTGGGGGKTGGNNMDHVLTSLHHIALPEGSIASPRTAASRMSYNSDYAQMPTQSSVTPSMKSQIPPVETLLKLYGNSTLSTSTSAQSRAAESQTINNGYGIVDQSLVGGQQSTTDIQFASEAGPSPHYFNNNSTVYEMAVVAEANEAPN